MKNTSNNGKMKLKIFGNMSVRGTEIFYEEYKQQWQDEIENIW